MNSQEKDNYGSHEAFDAKSLNELSSEHHERLKQSLENREVRSHEKLETVRQEALEQASRVEKPRGIENQPNAELTHDRQAPISKQRKAASFDATMKEVRSDMNPPSRAFSRIIHNPAIEKASDVVGGTIARPNAILSGSLCAFLLTLAIYLTARFNGYPLTGTETIAFFVLGWVIGIVFDYVRLLVTGRK